MNGLTLDIFLSYTDTYSETRIYGPSGVKDWKCVLQK